MQAAGLDASATWRASANSALTASISLSQLEQDGDVVESNRQAELDSEYQSILAGLSWRYRRHELAGRVESGSLAVGDELIFSPSNRTTRIATIEGWNTDGDIRHAEAGQSIGITLEEQIFVERGEIASHFENAPVETDVFHLRLFWLVDTPPPWR